MARVGAKIKQHVNLKMLDAFDELGIVFAVPARQLHVTSQDDLPKAQDPAEQH